MVSETVVADVVEGGVTEAYDMATGRELWSVRPPAGEKVLKQTGMRTGDEHQPEPGERRAIRVSDGRLVQLTASGRVLLRDMADGALLADVPSTIRPNQSTGLQAYGGRAYLSWVGKIPQVISVDLAAGEARSLHRGTDEGSVRMFPCGPELVCVATRTALVALDLDGAEVWRREQPDLINQTAFRGDRIVMSTWQGNVLLAADGTVLYQDKSVSGFTRIDDRNVLMMVGEPGAGKVGLVAVATEDGQATPLGSLTPALAMDCSTTDQVLACRDGTELKLWKLNR